MPVMLRLAFSFVEWPASYWTLRTRVNEQLHSLRNVQVHSAMVRTARARAER